MQTRKSPAKSLKAEEGGVDSRTGELATRPVTHRPDAAPASSREPIGSEPDLLPGGFDAPLAIRALEAAGTGVCIADARRPMLPLVWANEAFSERTGMPRAEIAYGSCRMLQWADTDPPELGRRSWPNCATATRPRWF